MRKVVVLGVVIGALFAFRWHENDQRWNEDTLLTDVLRALAYDQVSTVPTTIDKAWAKSGEEIIKQGETILPTGERTSRQSIHYKCIDCHNTVREEPNLSVYDATARLSYAKRNQLPFLPGTTLYGVVNRESWYNGDYINKYGDLVEKANKNLQEALQVCATTCSQGRALSQDEMKAVMHYLTKNGIKLGDLQMSKADWQSVHQFKLEGLHRESTLEMILSKYAKYSPATFLEKPSKKIDREAANLEDGRIIFEQGCLHCHAADGIAFYKLGNDKKTFKHLNNQMMKSGHFDLNWFVRKGTYPEFGRKAYMPNYTLERMSKEQMNSLKAYVEARALATNDLIEN